MDVLLTITFLGFGIEVYFIVAILGIPLFFLWRWVFRKMTPLAHKRVMIWLATIMSAPVFYVIIVLLFVSLSEYYPNRQFNKSSWQNDKGQRYEYSHDLIEQKILIGKSKAEVLRLLGNDADTSNVNELGYEIGYRPELTGIDPSFIVIKFKNAKVDTVIEHDK